MPDPLGDGAWQSITCIFEAVTESFMNSRTSWREVGADKAWEDLPYLLASIGATATKHTLVTLEACASVPLQMNEDC
jgi:hypothetical protein